MRFALHVLGSIALLAALSALNAAEELRCKNAGWFSR